MSQLKGWAHSTRCPRVAGVILLAALMSAACGPSGTRYFTLLVPRSPVTPAPKTRFVLQIEHFDAPDVLRDSRIIFYTSPTQLRYYQHDRWISEPGGMLSELAVKYFAETGLFRQVYPYPAPTPADYTLRGRVFDFAGTAYGKNDRDKGGEARLGLEMDLIATQQNKIVWSARLKDAEPLETKKVQGIVKAMNVAAERLFQQAYGGISQVVVSDISQKQEQAH
ncbi:MAG TPA: ABC-type transport auxiliary lipoprotein family protein [Terriglobia bacterium]|nr:ABC-type transport auxiliary lipoprotein family protein [Terriglobia bacterium]